MMGMLTHIVLFKLRDRSPANIEKAKEVLLGMLGKIPNCAIWRSELIFFTQSALMTLLL